MWSLQGVEQKEGRKEGRFLRVMLRSLTGRACGFLVELAEMNVSEDGTTRERGKAQEGRTLKKTVKPSNNIAN